MPNTARINLKKVAAKVGPDCGNLRKFLRESAQRLLDLNIACSSGLEVHVKSSLRKSLDLG